MSDTKVEIPELYNFKKAAKYLSVSRTTVYEYISKGLLHPVTVGDARFLLKDELEELKKKREGATNDEATGTKPVA
jgi:excisionase family DNA binding protein